MKLLSAVQIREWDQFTIRREPVASIDLMERAARACSKWLLQNTLTTSYYIFCGKGNNGGDGLAIARLLSLAGQPVKVFILESGGVGSDDFNKNFNHLREATKVTVTLLRDENDFPPIPTDAIIIDALFGTGLNRMLEGIAAALVQYLNASKNVIIAIDIPSGLLADASSLGNAIIGATHTLTFQCLKLAFLIPENEPFFGRVTILDINLHSDFVDRVESKYNLTNISLCRSIYKKRNPFSHKGNFGHALLCVGALGKMGAAVLSAKACLRAGVGLLSCQIPKSGIAILQTTVPEAMVLYDKDKNNLAATSYDATIFSAIGIGPGIGKAQTTQEVLYHHFMNYNKPMVLDADALNILAERNEWMPLIPENSILTPHPKEFERLFGKGLNDFQKIDIAVQKAKEHKVIIILKGHYSFIATPGGEAYFNITGNPGMATGGSGDALTGILTSLLAQAYQPVQAAILGVFIHGLAGDLAANKWSMEAMTAGDLIDELGATFKQLQ